MLTCTMLSIGLCKNMQQIQIALFLVVTFYFCGCVAFSLEIVLPAGMHLNWQHSKHSQIVYKNLKVCLFLKVALKVFIKLFFISGSIEILKWGCVKWSYGHFKEWNFDFPLKVALVSKENLSWNWICHQEPFQILIWMFLLIFFHRFSS